MQKIALIGLIALTAGFCFGACPKYDLTDDCWIGFDDFAALASEWLTGRREPVPSVLGMTQAEAERAIVAAGLTVGEVNLQYSETIAAGNIISQDPEADEFLAAGEPVAIVVSFGLSDFLPDITWVLIDDSGAGMKDLNGDPIDEGGFSGYISKFETTNAQYCKYLNQALTAGDIVVSGEGDYVKDATTDDDYYYLAGPGSTKDGATNGGAARINYNPISEEFTVDSGFENHPVTYVSWYGATAFAAHYGFRLPTEWEWQAVADYDGSYDWACGTFIHNGMANYKASTHPDGTTTVGTYGSYGYGMRDMTGNVGEWTSSVYMAGVRTIRDGNWGMLAYYCLVAQRPHGVLSLCGYSLGFRVVLDL